MCAMYRMEGRFHTVPLSSSAISMHNNIDLVRVNDGKFLFGLPFPRNNSNGQITYQILARSHEILGNSTRVQAEYYS
jgi:hypothetical protein